MQIKRKITQITSDDTNTRKRKCNDPMTLLSNDYKSRLSLTLLNDTNGTVFLSTNNQFASFYKPSILSLCTRNLLNVHFDAMGDQGIPKLVSKFKHLYVDKFRDGYNNQHMLPERATTMVDELHVIDYLECDHFVEDTLKNKKFDHVFFAFISFIAYWSLSSLRSFSKKYPKYEPLVFRIITERHQHWMYYDAVFDVIVVPKSLQIVSCYFSSLKSEILSEPSLPQFELNLTNEFLSHLNAFWLCLQHNDITNEMRKLIESPLPFAVHMHKLPKPNRHTAIRYITGTACVGKTTLLENLKKMGWIVRSRSDIGTFSGKAKDAASIAALHTALDYVLRKRNVIGDRGPIDNPLWSFIMHVINPTKVSHIVDQFIRFIESNMNLYTMCGYAEQQAIIIVDLFCEHNRRRMEQRCVNGDAHRSRIYEYPYVQTFCYYAIARLFNWPIFTVHYKDESIGTFDPEGYKSILTYIDENFEKPIDALDTVPVTNKPNNEFVIDHKYAKYIGIYK